MSVSEDSEQSVKEIKLISANDKPSLKPTILVVNDNYPLLSMLADMLEDDFKVTSANNGLEALDIVIARARSHFDAILLDINMPIMDGFETCEKIIKYVQSSGIICMVEVPESLSPSHFSDEPADESLFAPKEPKKSQAIK